MPGKRKKEKLIFVTSNRHKFAEIRKILEPHGIGLVRRNFDFIEGEGTSLRAEALNKAKQAFAKFKRPLIVEDTGFFFEAYRNFPGTQPKRMFEVLGYDGFFRLLRGKKRDAYAEVVICYISSLRNIHTFSGRMYGTITTKVHKPRADVMPYEKVFRLKGEKRVVAQMARDEKNAVSHRAIAARKLAGFLAKKGQ